MTAIPDDPLEVATIDQARAIAATGLRVLPIKPGRKNPPMASWQTAASVEEKAIAAWWNGLYRDHGIGVAMGPQPDGRNLFAVDIDTHDANGFDTLAALEAEHGPLPATVTSITGSNGQHLVFAAPAGVVVRNQQASGQRIGPGIDVRGNGGQIVVAPTVHPDTHRRYQWAPGGAPWQAEIADAPAWLLDMVVDRPAPAPTPPRQTLDTPNVTPTRTSAADLLRDRWDWASELAATGWQHNRSDTNGDTYYTRPGKDPRQGHSAVLHGTDGPFVVFTTDISAELRGLGHLTRDGSGYAYSPLEWHAAHRHGGDLSAASRDIIAANAPPTASHASQAVADDDDGDLVPSEDYDTALRDMLVDWGTFWAVDHNEAEWLAEPIIAAKRSTAIFAPGGTGKSLLSLYIAASLATGTRLFGVDVAPIDVLYLDYEMTADDLAERLGSMGFDESDDMSRLHYALLPSLPGLDQPEGGKAVVRLAEMCNAELVVIDTFGRAVHGDENEADTVRSWYRWTGIHLKHAGRAFLRVDHAGKDVTKGQRGTSAKNDDVDVVWQMTAKEAGTFTMTAKKRRMGWVPLTVDLVMLEDDRLHFERLSEHTYQAGTAAMATLLDDLGLPETVTKRAALKALRQAGHKSRDLAVTDAIRYRKERSSTYHFATDQPVDNSGTTTGTTTPRRGREPLREPLAAESALPQVDAHGNHFGNHWAPLADATGNHGAPLKGHRGTSVDSATPKPTDNDYIGDLF